MFRAMSRYADFLQIEAWEVITQERTLISCVNLLITRKCPYPQSTDWGFFYVTYRGKTVSRSRV